jgi:hypothetical protein
MIHSSTLFSESLVGGDISEPPSRSRAKHIWGGQPIRCAISFIRYIQTTKRVGLTFPGSMDGSQRLQSHPVHPVVAVSRENADATPHPSSSSPYPPMGGVQVGNVNKSIIADTVQNAQDVNFGNLTSSLGLLSWVTDNTVESSKGGGVAASGGVDQSILAHKVEIQGGVTYTSSKIVLPF